MFGEQHLGDTGHAGNSRAAAMADSAEVCGCNGVKQGNDLKAIREQGLFTLDEVRKRTKASGSCGSCTGLVEQILMFDRRRRLHGGAEAEGGVRLHRRQPPAGARRDPRAAPADDRRASTQHLGWRTPNGCASCRPAINYYLISTWPNEALDDPQSRFINERAHANIQKDGTFSVVPRMWGGETNASRAAPHRRRRRQVPDPDGQGHRRPAHRPARREEGGPDRRSGRTSACPRATPTRKTLRTVKTCVGSEWCRFGTQDSTRDGQGARARALAHVRAAQGQARGQRLPAQLRRGGHQGRRRDRRRFGLGDLRRRQRRHQDRGRAVLLQGEDARARCSSTRRVPAALSRGRLVPRAHGALRRPRRPRPRQGEGRSTTPTNRSALAERLRSRSTASPIPGSSTTRRASTCASSSRSRSEDDADERLEDDLPRRRHPAARRAQASTRAERRRHRRLPHRRRHGVRAARPLPAQGRAAVAGHRLRRAASPARCTTGPSASPTAARRRPTSAARSASRAGRGRRASRSTWPSSAADAVTAALAPAASRAPIGRSAAAVERSARVAAAWPRPAPPAPTAASAAA